MWSVVDKKDTQREDKIERGFVEAFQGCIKQLRRSLKLLTILARRSILDVFHRVFSYTSVNYSNF